MPKLPDAPPENLRSTSYSAEDTAIAHLQMYFTRLYDEMKRSEGFFSKIIAQSHAPVIFLGRMSKAQMRSSVALAGWLTVFALGISACWTRPDRSRENASEDRAHLFELCIELETRINACVDDYAPALAAARARQHKQAGSAYDVDAEVPRIRRELTDGYSRAALEAWCKEVSAQPLTVQERAKVRQARECLALSTCKAFAECVVVERPVTEADR